MKENHQTFTGWEKDAGATWDRHAFNGTSIKQISSLDTIEINKNQQYADFAVLTTWKKPEIKILEQTNTLKNDKQNAIIIFLMFFKSRIKPALVLENFLGTNSDCEFASGIFFFLSQIVLLRLLNGN